MLFHGTIAIAVIVNWRIAEAAEHAERSARGAIFDAHPAGGRFLLALIALHILGALKRTFIDRDGGIFRMLPFGRVGKNG